MVTSPAGALAPLPCCHPKGDTIRVGVKDGGERGDDDFFFSFLRVQPGERCGIWEGGRGGRGRWDARVAPRRANPRRKVVKMRGTRGNGNQGIDSCATPDGPKWTAQRRELIVVRMVWEIRGGRY